MIGSAFSPRSSYLHHELELNSLFDLNDKDAFLEGRVAFGGATVDLFLKALRANRWSRVGLIATFQSFLIDSLKRKEYLQSFLWLLKEMQDHLQKEQAIPEFVLDLTQKDLAIALLEVVPKEDKCRIMTYFRSLGYPLPPSSA